MKEITARIATTHPVEKYGGIRLSRDALGQMVMKLNEGRVPMNFDHSALAPLDVKNLKAQLVDLEDDEAAVDISFEIEDGEWAAVEEQFSTMDVAGGFSFTAGVTQISTPDGEPPVIAFSADAAAFSDSDRAAAGAILGELAPVEVNRLFQFNAVDLARVIVEIWPEVATQIGLNIAASAIYDGVMRAVGRRREATTIEIQRHLADGSKTTAVVTSSDPVVIQKALDTLADSQREPTIYFDTGTGTWLALPPPAEADPCGKEPSR